MRNQYTNGWISNGENNKHTIKPEKAQILADFFWLVFPPY